MISQPEAAVPARRAAGEQAPNGVKLQAPNGVDPEATDPELGRLRALLRLQLQSVDAGTWAAFHALSATVRDELDRHGTGPANEAAIAEVAHLQVRLELSLRDRLSTAAVRLQQLAALRAYQAHTLR